MDDDRLGLYLFYNKQGEELDFDLNRNGLSSIGLFPDGFLFEDRGSSSG